MLLLLLLARVEHPPLGERDGLVKHGDIADVVGEHENQRRVEIGALFVAQAAMRLDDGAKRVVRFRKIRTVDSAITKPQLMPAARASAASSAGRVGCRNRAAT